jgi:hypothetical protein
VFIHPDLRRELGDQLADTQATLDDALCGHFKI